MCIAAKSNGEAYSALESMAGRTSAHMSLRADDWITRMIEYVLILNLDLKGSIRPEKLSICVHDAQSRTHQRIAGN